MRENSMKFCMYYLPKGKRCVLFNKSMCWDGFVFNKDGTCDVPFETDDTCEYYRPRINLRKRKNAKQQPKGCH